MTKKRYRNTTPANLKRTQSSQRYIVIIYKIIEHIGAVSKGKLQGEASRGLIADWLNDVAIPPPSNKDKLGDEAYHGARWHKSQVGRILKESEALEIDLIAKDIRIKGSTLSQFIDSMLTKSRSEEVTTQSLDELLQE